MWSKLKVLEIKTEYLGNMDITIGYLGDMEITTDSL